MIDNANVNSLLGMKVAQDSAIKPTATSPDEAKQAAQEFESLFLSQMMQHMMSGVKTDPVFGGGQAEEMFRGLMVDEWAKQAAQSGGVGLAASVERHLLQLQEV